MRIAIRDLARALDVDTHDAASRPTTKATGSTYRGRAENPAVSSRTVHVGLRGISVGWQWSDPAIGGTSKYLRARADLSQNEHIEGCARHAGGIKVTTISAATANT